MPEESDVTKIYPALMYSYYREGSKQIKYDDGYPGANREKGSGVFYPEKERRVGSKLKTRPGREGHGNSCLVSSVS